MFINFSWWNVFLCFFLLFFAEFFEPKIDQKVFIKLSNLFIISKINIFINASFHHFWLKWCIKSKAKHEKSGCELLKRLRDCERPNMLFLLKFMNIPFSIFCIILFIAFYHIFWYLFFVANSKVMAQLAQKNALQCMKICKN